MRNNTTNIAKQIAAMQAQLNALQRSVNSKRTRVTASNSNYNVTRKQRVCANKRKRTCTCASVRITRAQRATLARAVKRTSYAALARSANVTSARVRELVLNIAAKSGHSTRACVLTAMLKAASK